MSRRCEIALRRYEGPGQARVRACTAPAIGSAEASDAKVLAERAEAASQDDIAGVVSHEVKTDQESRG